MSSASRIRVLYSFPHALGADRICYTAWQQVNGLAEAGADVVLFPASVRRPTPPGVKVACTLAVGKARLPYRIIGSDRAFAWHDAIVARRLPRLAGRIDVVHAWPRGARRTLAAAAALGIPTVLERPNAHTRFAYEVVRDECARLGVQLPPDHEHAFNEDVLRIEEEEFELASSLLCPSDFVVQTYLDRGFDPNRLVRHIYGFDPMAYHPAASYQAPSGRGLNALFVGVCAVRKGVHFAVEAWLRSSASATGTLRIAGQFLPDYAAKLEPMLRHPSIQILGHRTDVPELMRRSDVLVLPSIEEGFGLVCTEAMGSGCVPLVSTACTDLCRHGHNALIHNVGDVETLAGQFSQIDRDRGLLQSLRYAGLGGLDELTWSAAGRVLVDSYREAIRRHDSLRMPLGAATT